MEKIKIGIIGTGGMGGKHARIFREIRGVELFMCYDVDKTRARDFSRKYGFSRCAASAEELIDACDAINVVTPDEFHAELSLQILNAGKHLLCEKPLATNLTDARRVAQRAIKSQRSGSAHMINFSYRDSSAVQEAIRCVQHGDLGDIRHVHCNYLQSWLVSSVWGSWDSPSFLWRLQTSRGSTGVLGDVGCHILDLATAVAGDLEAVDCVLATFPKSDRRGRKRRRLQGGELDANDTAIIRLHFANGALGVCHTTRWATGHLNSINVSVHGTQGALRIDLDEGFDRLYICYGKNVNPARWTVRKVRATPNVYRRFVRWIRSGEPDQPDIVRGAQIQSYLDACFRSARGNGKLTRTRTWL